jgi:glycosidase
MKQKLFFLIFSLLAISSTNAQSSVAIVGDGAGGWPGAGVDTNQMTSTDGVNWTILNVAITDGYVKFRGNNSWTSPYNWGGTAFPSGTAVLNSNDGIHTSAGFYNINFNSTTRVYNFFAVISLAGTGVSGLASGTDINLSSTDGINYSYTGISLVPGSVKFRKNHSDLNIWGSNSNTSNFPQGTAIQNGQNIITIAGRYNVNFNIITGGYTFYFPLISLVHSPPAAGPAHAEDAVIYQVNIRAFSSAGNLNGVKARLSSIKELGANVIYLMPIHPVGVLNSAGGLGSPYSIKDYLAVNTEFGTLQDLRDLVNEAHKLDMAVMLDWVANHTSWDNPWITEHSDWYVKDANGNILSPPGWNDVAELNYNNIQMRSSMIEAMKYWVYNANIDGFRCDHADGVPYTFWSQAITQLRTIQGKKLLMLAEGVRQDHFTAGFDYTFGFNYFTALKNVYSQNQPATSLQNANVTEYANINDNSKRIVRYTSNHDVNYLEGTPQELFDGNSGSVAAFVVAAYMKSVPMIYNAQEIGYLNRIPFFTHTPINWNTGNASMLVDYKKIIAFRNSSNAIKKGSYTGYSSNKVCVFTMQINSEKVLVISNLSNTTSTYLTPASLSQIAWKDVFNNSANPLSTQITLLPYQYLVLKN